MSELILQNVSKTYRTGQTSRCILDSITLRVRSGELVVLLGPSGCGKTTLLKIIAGLVPPDDGPYVLTVDGGIITSPGPDRNIVFQNYTSYPWLTVLENVRFGLQFGDIPLKEQYTRAEECVRMVRLWEYRDEYPKVLSGGQQQRVAIARTLAARPRVILMDEPFAALDAQTREGMQTELLQLRARSGSTILFVTHDIAEAAFLGDRVLILSQIPARIIEEVLTGNGSEAHGDRVGAGQRPLQRSLPHASERGDEYRYGTHFLDIQRHLKERLARPAGE
jgi:NitT/TauT family transport system ATP-binding protein